MSPSHGARASSKAVILDVVESIITDGSVGGLTLEAVAAGAGLTKGGLIYHFKSKEALLHALVERMTGQVGVHCASDTVDPRRALRNFLVARIDYAFAIGARQKRAMANLLAATAKYPSLLAPVKRMYERGTGDLSRVDGSAGLALSVWTALDGFVLLEMLNIRHFSDDEKSAMKQALIALVEQRLSGEADQPGPGSGR